MDKKTFEATTEQIDLWKKQHGEVFRLEVEGHVAYLKKPSRKVMSMALSTGKNDPIKFGEIILNNCWIEGDRQIIDEDKLFFGAMGQLDQMIEFAGAELKKL
jgi:hypothetical protein